MAYFDELLQRAITVRNNVAPSSNTALLVGGVLVSIVNALQMLLDDKQEALTFDTAPTADSQNPVTSDGIYQALQAIDLSACEKIVNKVTSINAQSTDVQYPTAKLLYDSLQALSGIYAAIVHTHAIADIINLQTELNARQLVSNLVTAITAQSTDQQYPSAKLLYDQLQGLAAVYAPKVHTHPFADIERPANVASVNAQGYTITTAYYSHVLTITADATLHLPTMQSGAAIILRLTIIQDATGGRAVTFDGGAALVFNPYQTDLSQGQANYRCWVVLWFDGVNWAWLASPYVLRAESQFAYTIDGTTGGQYVTVTINGTTMQIQATSGVWQYGYNNPINSIAFTGDTGVLNVDFTNSDGLANITTLADAFKNCAALVAVDFTGCDLSNVATAADCFAGCTSLAALTIPTGTWKPDIDLSACAAFTKAAMLAVIDGLYTYASGTHTVTFNSTAWNALSQADQQIVFDAAGAKGWTTNAPMVVYVIRGTSSNVGGTETFKVQYIQDGALLPDNFITEEVVNVDANGDWEFSYYGKKMYALCRYDSSFATWHFANTSSTLLTCDFSAAESDELFAIGADAGGNIIGAAFMSCTNLVSVSFKNLTLSKVVYGSHVFRNCHALQEVDYSDATFAELQRIGGMFGLCENLTTIKWSANLNLNNLRSLQAFPAYSNGSGAFANCQKLTDASIAPFCAQTFPNIMAETTGGGLFYNCKAITTIDMRNATMPNLQRSYYWFAGCNNLTTLRLNSATFSKVNNSQSMFQTCSALSSIEVPQNSTAILQTSTAANAPMPLASCPLDYASMLAVANWLSDLTGYTAHTCTFNTTAWNALTAAEQSNIDTILSGKNWTRVLA